MILHVLNTAYRFILHAKKTAFIIEHDFIMATYLADRVIVFEGTPAIAATATPFVLILALSVETSQPN
jgi:ATP-binding cassette subfamily E protein 1